MLEFKVRVTQARKHARDPPWLLHGLFCRCEAARVSGMAETIEFFTIHVSVRLSDRSEVTQHKINFVKKMLPVGFELTTSRSSVSCSAR